MNLAIEEVIADGDDSDSVTPTQGDDAYAQKAPVGLEEPMTIEYI